MYHSIVEYSDHTEALYRVRVYVAQLLLLRSHIAVFPCFGVAAL